jgi:hypothetical protein
MKTGANYIHKGYPSEYSCTILELTNRGAKVMFRTIQGKKTKEKIQYFDAIDFHPEKGLWRMAE